MNLKLFKKEKISSVSQNVCNDLLRGKKKLLAWYGALNCYFFEFKKCYGNVEMKNYFKLK